MYSKLEVMQSNAGYYIGRHHVDEDGFEEPGTRESHYYATREDAVEAVRVGFYLRHCPENFPPYYYGDIDTRPGFFYQDEEFTG